MERSATVALVAALGLAPACSRSTAPPAKASISISPAPEYTPAGIAPSGATRPGPLAPGRIASLFGAHLGPSTPCHGAPDPSARETPSAERPRQTALEIQVFPNRLCDTEVFIGGTPAGLLYVSAGQINFKTPQSVRTSGSTTVQVRYEGRLGPTVAVPLAPDSPRRPADQIAAAMWTQLQRVTWQRDYRAACLSVPPHQSLRRGLYDYAYVCSQSQDDVVAETFYYPVDYAAPKIRLLRADLRPAATYPEFSVEVEQALSRALTQAYGPGTVPDNIYEIGATRPAPGLSWRTSGLTILLHHNRMHTAPAGVREGVVLIAVRDEVMASRAKALSLDPKTPAPAPLSAQQAATALLSLLRSPDAAKLVEADSLALRLGGLLVARSVEHGSEQLALVPEAARVRSRLAAYGVKYGDFDHYSGDLTYDRSLLKRAWTEYPGSEAGQRAFLMLQRLSCSTPLFGCRGQDCFRPVIEQGQRFLESYPDSRFRTEQTYHLALAYDTWWSLSMAQPDDPTAQGAKVTKESGEQARQAAIRLYEEVIAAAPGTPAATAAELSLPRLKLKLDTAERTFFCFSC